MGKRKAGVILNPVLDQISEPVDMMKKKPKKEPYKVLSASIEFAPRALVIHWVIKYVGFGMLSYYFDKNGKICKDLEGLNEELVSTIFKFLEKELTNKKSKKVKISENSNIDLNYLINFIQNIHNQSK